MENNFLEELGEEREARIQPSTEFVKAKLESVEIVEIKTGNAAKFTFRNEAGEIFTQNILEPFNEGSTAVQRSNNIEKIIHLFGAFIKSPVISVEVGKNKTKREVKQVFNELPARDIKSITEYLVSKFVPQWRELECTLKIVYIDKKNKNNIIQFPLYPPFINTVISHKYEVSTWKWSELYDFLTPQHKDDRKTDNEGGAGNEGETFNHADGSSVTF